MSVEMGKQQWKGILKEYQHESKMVLAFQEVPDLEERLTGAQRPNSQGRQRLEKSQRREPESLSWVGQVFQVQVISEL